MYRNDAIEVHWEPRFAHSRSCIRRLGKVFDSSARPWIDVDAADPDEIAETILTCPTGALHFRRVDGGDQEVGWAETADDPRPNGRSSYVGA